MLLEILSVGLIISSLIVVFAGILSIKEKAIRKYFLFVAILTIVFLSTAFIANAQEKPTEMKEHRMTMQNEDLSAGRHDMQKCMDKIASDEHIRGEMMGMMMEHMKDDSTGMMKMCKMMMDNPEMMKMMMNMMHGENGMMGSSMMNHDMMKNDSIKVIDKSEHEKHHNK